ncbi:MAG: PaeR7I family type II restriction endonuclease [Pirellulales bacterium]|nr:PaeR7I family type II restriction endonuclease [Pirellulales bacterium]
MQDLEKRVSKAIRHFWATRNLQALNQGSGGGQKDRGARSAVTGGAHMDGFVKLTRQLLIEAGVPKSAIFASKKLDLPGFFRPEKKWDLLVVPDGQLLACIEFKSQVGPSFGNNFNNRTEESLGNATDLWTAYREGAFQPSKKPWLGYVMMLEDAPGSSRPVKVKESHFNVFKEFREASYAKRYEILLTKLLRERLYDGACLLMSTSSEGKRGKYHEPSEELAFSAFAISLAAQGAAFSKHRSK